jgi:hypothetical protein
MSLLVRRFVPQATAFAHRDLQCGVYDPATADALLAKIEDISRIFWETKQG